MHVVSTIVGIALVCVALQDIFASLFHPAAHGAMSDWIARLLWRCFRWVGGVWPPAMTLAGPIIFLGIVGTWTSLVVSGFCLIYLTQIHGGFALAAGLDPAAHQTFLDAFNISLGALITVTGDFNAHSQVIRLAMGLEAVFGMGILTASVSWLLSIYPVLEQRRAFAHKATLIHHAETVQQLDLLALSESDAAAVLMEMAAEVLKLRNALDQFPISYYFHMGEQKSALPGVLMYVFRLAGKASESEQRAVRLAGTLLGGAVVDLTETIAVSHLHTDERDPVVLLRRFAGDHRRELVSPTR